MMEEYLEEMQGEMRKSVDHLRAAMVKIRTGRASLAILDGVRVDYYGSPTPLNGIASLTVPEPRMIIVKPWDGSMLGAIERAIGGSNLGITPNNDGKILRLVFPELTGDRRKELVRQVEQMAEQAKVGVRSARRDYNELFKGVQKDGEITEDDLKRLLDVVQKHTDRWCEKADDVVKIKEKEILEV